MSTTTAATIWARLPADAQPGDYTEVILDGTASAEAAAIAAEEGLTVRPDELVPVVEGASELLAAIAADPCEPFDPSDFEPVAGGARYRERALA